MSARTENRAAGASRAPATAPSWPGWSCRAFGQATRLLHRLARLLFGLLELEHELVRRVVLVDVAHVGGCLDPNLLRRDYLDVVEPRVRVEATLHRFLAHASD